MVLTRANVAFYRSKVSEGAVEALADFCAASLGSHAVWIVPFHRELQEASLKLFGYEPTDVDNEYYKSNCNVVHNPSAFATEYMIGFVDWERRDGGSENKLDHAINDLVVAPDTLGGRYKDASNAALGQYRRLKNSFYERQGANKPKPAKDSPKNEPKPALEANKPKPAPEANKPKPVQEALKPRNSDQNAKDDANIRLRADADAAKLIVEKGDANKALTAAVFNDARHEVIHSLVAKATRYGIGMALACAFYKGNGVILEFLKKREPDYDAAVICAAHSCDAKTVVAMWQGDNVHNEHTASRALAYAVKRNDASMIKFLEIKDDACMRIALIKTISKIR